MKRVLGVGLGLVLLATLGFVIWAATPLKAAPEALAALQSDAAVQVESGSYTVFRPTQVEPTTAFVFYPGGHVDYRAYAVPLRRIAEQGYLVILLPVRLNLAFFDLNAADRVLPDFPQIQHWVVGGHSLGGVAAASYASTHSQLAGLVLWASYPADATLKAAPIRVLSLYGSLDMAGLQVFDESRAKLPSNAEFTVIEGGNHGQFGDYGAQPGDNPASISRTDQQAQIVAATVQFLQSLDR